LNNRLIYCFGDVVISLLFQYYEILKFIFYAIPIYFLVFQVAFFFEDRLVLAVFAFSLS
jgi:hypothetical protein